MQTMQAELEAATNIVVLDDSYFDRARLKRVLRKLAVPITIREADSLRAFKRIVEESLFDLAFVDYDLPDGTGLDALKCLRETQSTPAIMVTGNTASYIQEFAKRDGCAEIILKPSLSETSLRLVISSALGVPKQTSTEHSSERLCSRARNRTRLTISVNSRFPDG